MYACICVYVLENGATPKKQVSSGENCVAEHHIWEQLF